MNAEPTYTCGECGRVVVVRRDGRGFPPDIAKRRLVRLLDQRTNDLRLVHRRDLFRIERLRVEATCGDDGQVGLHRRLLDELEIAAHRFGACIDDATVCPGLTDRVSTMPSIGA